MRVKFIHYRLDRFTQWRDGNMYRHCSIDCVSQTDLSPYFDPYIVCLRAAGGKVIPLFSSRATGLYYGVEGRWTDI